MHICMYGGIFVDFSSSHMRFYFAILKENLSYINNISKENIFRSNENYVQTYFSQDKHSGVQAKFITVLIGWFCI